MRKATLKKNGMGWLTAASLAATLAMFGCTSNQYAGNGQPTRVTPTIDTVNHSMTYGSSSGTEGTIPPMASSYTPSPAAPSVNVDALAVLAADRGFRGYVLGPADPGGTQQNVAVSSGQFESPANAVLPQSTVNSSINSQPVPAITGGDVTLSGGAIAAASPIPTLTGGGGATTTASTAATTAAPTSSAATSALTTSTGAPTVAGSGAFSPVLMNSTPAPQATGTTGPTLRTVVATGRAVNGNTRTSSTARTSALRATTGTTTSTATGTAASGIHLNTTQSGGIVMTNVAPAVKGTSGK